MHGVPATMLLLTAAALLLASCSAESVSFSIPVPEFTDSDGKPGHMDIVFQPDGGVSDVDIYNQYTCIRNQALDYVGKGRTEVKLDENNTWVLSGPVETFLKDVKENCSQLFKAKVNTTCVVKGALAKGVTAPTTINLDFPNIQLNHTPGAIDKFTQKLSFYTYNFNVFRRVKSNRLVSDSHPKDVLLKIDTDVVWLRDIPHSMKTESEKISIELRAKYPNSICKKGNDFENCVLSKLPLVDLPNLIFKWNQLAQYKKQPQTDITKVDVGKTWPLTIEVKSDQFSCSRPTIDLTRFYDDHKAYHNDPIAFVTLFPKAQQKSSTENWDQADLYTTHDYLIANTEIFKTASEKAAAEKAAKEKAAKEKAAAEKAAKEKAAAEKAAKEKAAAEKAAKEKAAAADKAAKEKDAADKAAKEKDAAAEKAAKEKDAAAAKAAAARMAAVQRAREEAAAKADAARLADILRQAAEKKSNEEAAAAAEAENLREAAAEQAAIAARMKASETKNSQVKPEISSQKKQSNNGDKTSSHVSSSSLKPKGSGNASPLETEENSTQKAKKSEVKKENESEGNNAVIKTPLIHLGAAIIFMMVALL